jgi:hypothetical protein
VAAARAVDIDTEKRIAAAPVFVMKSLNVSYIGS